METTDLIMSLASELSDVLGEDLEFVIMVLPSENPSCMVNIATDMEPDQLVWLFEKMISRLKHPTDSESVH